MEQILKKYRKEITEDLMDFLERFEVKDEDYLYLELRYLSKVVENFKDRLVSTEENVRKIYNENMYNEMEKKENGL